MEEWVGRSDRGQPFGIKSRSQARIRGAGKERRGAGKRDGGDGGESMGRAGRWRAR